MASYKVSMRPEDYRFIPLTDDWMFKTVFSDPPLLRALLERALPDVQIEDLTSVLPEHTMQRNFNAHAIKLDIEALTVSQMFNTEMQKETKKMPLKRPRYYLSMMDVIDLRSGKPYTKLRDSYQIIITMSDPFSDNRMVYVCENADLRSGASIKEGRRTVWINCAGTEGQEEWPQLVPFCRYVMGTMSDDAFVKAIDEKVQYYNNDENWRITHMKWEEYKAGLIETGEKRGEKRGIAKGRKTEKISAVLTLYRRLTTLGIEKEQAIQYVHDDYPDLSDHMIRKILSV